MRVFSRSKFSIPFDFSKWTDISHNDTSSDTVPRCSSCMYCCTAGVGNPTSENAVCCVFTTPASTQRSAIACQLYRDSVVEYCDGRAQ